MTCIASISLVDNPIQPGWWDIWARLFSSFQPKTGAGRTQILDRSCGLVDDYISILITRILRSLFVDKRRVPCRVVTESSDGKR